MARARASYSSGTDSASVLRGIKGLEAAMLDLAKSFAIGSVVKGPLSSYLPEGMKDSLPGWLRVFGRRRLKSSEIYPGLFDRVQYKYGEVEDGSNDFFLPGYMDVAPAQIMKTEWMGHYVGSGFSHVATTGLIAAAHGAQLLVKELFYVIDGWPASGGTSMNFNLSTETITSAIDMTSALPGGVYGATDTILGGLSHWSEEYGAPILDLGDTLVLAINQDPGAGRALSGAAKIVEVDPLHDYWIKT